MVWRSICCLLAGSLLTPGPLPSQTRDRDVTIRIAGPTRNFAPGRLGSPPVRVPLLRSPLFQNAGQSGFPQLAQAAGIIFAGTVVRIQRQPAIPGQTLATVAITLHVDSGMRGTSSGKEITIREWMGLWSSGQRYRPGEKALFFLYPRSRLGLTSWVGGPLGRFVLDSTGQVVLSAQQMTAFRKDSALGGKSRLPLSDFALAVRRSGEEE